MFVHAITKHCLLGFTDNKDTLWQEMCSTQKNALEDPYLRATFAFLTSSSDKYDTVLVKSYFEFLNDVILFANSGCEYS